MTLDLLMQVGGEWVMENNTSGATVTVGLYLDATDALTETDNLSAVTTEPSNTNYARQSSTVTTSLLSGSYGFNNDSQLSFDFSDQSSSQDVDGALDIVNFQSDTVAGDGSASDNLIGNPALSQTRDIGSIDTLDIPAGDLSLTVDN